jgi:hypothetical protein
MTCAPYVTIDGYDDAGLQFICEEHNVCDPLLCDDGGRANQVMLPLFEQLVAAHHEQVARREKKKRRHDAAPAEAEVVFRPDTMHFYGSVESTVVEANPGSTFDDPGWRYNLASPWEESDRRRVGFAPGGPR